MQDLIQKLEKATEGSPLLDRDIEDEIGEWINLGGWWRRHKISDAERAVLNYAPAPAYTTSLDAALTLVPEGMEWEATNLYGIARASVGINADDGPFYGTSEFGSVPVALCIAALRARHSQSSDDPRKNLSERQEGV